MKKAYLVLITYVLILSGSCLANSSYTEEMKQAHQYAYNNGITTIESIENAKMYSDLNRISMAKMISNFAINILGLTPNYSLNCTFKDVSANKDAQYDYGVTKACQLGLMGIGDDGKISEFFNPDGVVTRGQRTTAFSRALSKANGDTVKEGNPYYRNHMKYLNSKGIIKDINNPSYNSTETRGNVMLMMKRTGDILSSGNNIQENNNQSNITQENSIENINIQENNTQNCDTDESCLNYLNGIREIQHEMTCINSEALGGEDRTYLIDGYVASLSPMLNMLSDNTNLYLWGGTYGDGLGILAPYTGNNIVEDNLSALSKVLKLGTPLICTPGVTDKSVFQIPNDIEFLSRDEYIEKVSD